MKKTALVLMNVVGAPFQLAGFLFEYAAETFQMGRDNFHAAVDLLATPDIDDVEAQLIKDGWDVERVQMDNGDIALAASRPE